MNDAKYIGLDVHQATISAAVLDSSGKLLMEAILATQGETILQFIGEVSNGTADVRLPQEKTRERTLTGAQKRHEYHYGFFVGAGAGCELAGCCDAG
jgi:hypothetical protein